MRAVRAVYLSNLDARTHPEWMIEESLQFPSTVDSIAIIPDSLGPALTVFVNFR